MPFLLVKTFICRISIAFYSTVFFMINRLRAVLDPSNAAAAMRRTHNPTQKIPFLRNPVRNNRHGGLNFNSWLIRGQLSQNGMAFHRTCPRHFSDELASETDKWENVIKIILAPPFREQSHQEQKPSSDERFPLPGKSGVSITFTCSTETFVSIRCVFFCVLSVGPCWCSLRWI